MAELGILALDEKPCDECSVASKVWRLIFFKTQASEKSRPRALRKLTQVCTFAFIVGALPTVAMAQWGSLDDIRKAVQSAKTQTSPAVAQTPPSPTNQPLTYDELVRVIKDAEDGGQFNPDSIRDYGLKNLAAGVVHLEGSGRGAIKGKIQRDGYIEIADAVKYPNSLARQKPYVMLALPFMAQIYEYGAQGKRQTYVAPVAIYDFLAKGGDKNAAENSKRLKELLSEDELASAQRITAAMETAPDLLSEVSKGLAEVYAMPYWTDAKTGLTWTTCPLGAVIDPSTSNCSTVEGGGGSLLNVTWYEAARMAKDANVGGFTDWRLPTVEEVQTIVKCRYEDWHAEEPDKNASLGLKMNNDLSQVEGGNLGCPSTSSNNVARFLPGVRTRSTWTSTSSNLRGARETENTKKYPPRILVSTDQSYQVLSMGERSSMRATTVLVRGGTVGPEWGQALIDADAVTKLVANLQADADRKMKAQFAAYDAANKRNAEANQARRAKYDADTATLRNNVKAGDNTVQGLVLEVKGDLVQLQTRERSECATRGGQDDGWKCFKWQIIPSQAMWVSRGTLLPVQ